MPLLTRRRALFVTAGLVAATPTALLATSALAKGNLAHDPVKLPELKIDTADLKYSETSYTLETGKFYWWTITSDGIEENMGLAAPELFANSWVYRVTAGDDQFEVFTQALEHLEFNGAGSMTIQFVPIQPGHYDFYTPGYENRGLKGTILVN
jgi:hypothetical protein